MSDTKVCKACGVEKPLDDFYYSGGKPQHHCKECHKAYNKAYRDANPKNGLPDGDERHGTVSGYIYHNCRCDLCKAGHHDYMAARRSKAREAKMGTRGPGITGNAADGSTGALMGRYSTGPACKGLPTKMWYPEAGDQAQEAKAICRGCSERIPCATKGVVGVEYGIWGATAPEHRVKIRRDMERAKKPELVICLACDNVSVIDTEDPFSSRCWNCGSHHEIDGRHPQSTHISK